MNILAHVCELYGKPPQPNPQPKVSQMDVNKAVDETWRQFSIQFEDGECTLSWCGELFVDHPVFDTKELTGFVNGAAFLMQLDIVEDFLEHIEDEFRRRCRRSYISQKRDSI